MRLNSLAGDGLPAAVDKDVLSPKLEIKVCSGSWTWKQVEGSGASDGGTIRQIEIESSSGKRRKAEPYLEIPPALWNCSGSLRQTSAYWGHLFA